MIVYYSTKSYTFWWYIAARQLPTFNSKGHKDDTSHTLTKKSHVTFSNY